MSPTLFLEGEDTFNFFGNSVAAAGDVNGDGIDDLVVGAPQNDEGGPDAGKAYVSTAPTAVSAKLIMML